MALPVMQTPSYDLVIPSTKQKVKFRPFLVKEEKALLLAQQSEDQNVMLNTLKGVIEACTMNKVNVEKLAMFDIEYIFLQLRSKSVGEISELVFSCMQCKDPKAKMNVDIDISKIEVVFNPEHKSDIQLFDDVGIKMKYPGVDLINKIKNVEENDVNAIFDMIVSCIDCIYDTDNVYHASEQSKEELEEFINNLTQDQFAKVQKFFETMPKLEKVVEFDCPVCKYHHIQILQGIDGFF